MKRIYLKRRKKHNKILFIIIVLTSVFLMLKYINKNISPKLIEYASEKIKSISNLVITKSVSIKDIEGLDINDLFIITKNNKNEILTVDLNTVLVNKLSFSITNKIQENLKLLEQGKINEYNEEGNGVIIKIPLGEATNNFLFSDMGPKISVRMKLLGTMDTNIKTTVTNYGLNNALIETYLEITITELVIIPIKTNEITVTSRIPLMVKLINGTVPNFYPNGIIERGYNEEIQV